MGQASRQRHHRQEDEPAVLSCRRAAGAKDPPVSLQAAVGLLHGCLTELIVCNRRVLLWSGELTATWLRVGLAVATQRSVLNDQTE